MDPSDVEVIETTVEKYDMKQLSTQFFQFIVGLVILGAMHFHWYIVEEIKVVRGYIRPLTLQVILGLKTLAGVPLVQVHVFGQPAVASLARPWKPKGMFGYDDCLFNIQGRCCYTYTQGTKSKRKEGAKEEIKSL